MRLERRGSSEPRRGEKSALAELLLDPVRPIGRDAKRVGELPRRLGRNRDRVLLEKLDGDVGRHVLTDQDAQRNPGRIGTRRLVRKSQSRY